MFIQRDLFRLYVLARAYRFEDQAKYVARKSEPKTVKKLSDAGALGGLNADSFRYLLSFVTEGREDRAPLNPCRDCGALLKKGHDGKTKQDPKVSYPRTEDPYVKTSEDRSRRRCATCGTLAPLTREDVDRIIRERADVIIKWAR